MDPMEPLVVVEVMRNALQCLLIRRLLGDRLRRRFENRVKQCRSTDPFAHVRVSAWCRELVVVSCGTFMRLERTWDGPGSHAGDPTRPKQNPARDPEIGILGRKEIATDGTRTASMFR